MIFKKSPNWSKENNSWEGYEDNTRICIICTWAGDLVVMFGDRSKTIISGDQIRAISTAMAFIKAGADYPFRAVNDNTIEIGGDIGA